jgi:hypothetical protein
MEDYPKQMREKNGRVPQKNENGRRPKKNEN